MLTSFKNNFKILFLLCGINFTLTDICAQDIKLATPQSNIDKGIITHQPVKLYFDFRMHGAEVRYTTDGSTPTLKSKKYTDTLLLSKPCVIKAKAFHPSFTTSDEIICTIIKAGKELASVTINQPNPKYKADGSWTIRNNKLGNKDHSKEYLGFEGEPIILDVAFDKKTKTKEVIISTLINQSAWIFSPSTIVIMDENNKLITHKNFPSAVQQQNNQYTFISIPCKGKYKSLRIIIDPIDVIPNWHEGKGGKPWLFVDEVMVY